MKMFATCYQFWSSTNAAYEKFSTFPKQELLVTQMFATNVKNKHPDYKELQCQTVNSVKQIGSCLGSKLCA